MTFDSGIMYCPYVPVTYSEDNGMKSMEELISYLSLDSQRIIYSCIFHMGSLMVDGHHHHKVHQFITRLKNGVSVCSYPIHTEIDNEKFYMSVESIEYGDWFTDQDFQTDHDGYIREIVNLYLGEQETQMILEEVKFWEL